MTTARDNAEPDADTMLEALLPSAEWVALNDAGDGVQVRELTIAELQPIVAEFRRVLGTVGSDATTADLIAGSLDSACVVAAACTNIAAEKWRRASASKLLVVVTAAIRANLDFFVRCAEVMALLGAITNPPNGAGPTPSATSSGAATPTP